jgi:hypothetical protein
LRHLLHLCATLRHLGGARWQIIEIIAFAPLRHLLHHLYRGGAGGGGSNEGRGVSTKCRTIGLNFRSHNLRGPAADIEEILGSETIWKLAAPRPQVQRRLLEAIGPGLEAATLRRHLPADVSRSVTGVSSVLKPMVSWLPAAPENSRIHNSEYGVS